MNRIVTEYNVDRDTKFSKMCCKDTIIYGINTMQGPYWLNLTSCNGWKAGDSSQLKHMIFLLSRLKTQQKQHFKPCSHEPLFYDIIF